VEWPAVIKPRITEHPACVTDLLPTIADFLELPKDAFPHLLDGISLRPLFAGEVGPRKAPIGFRFESKAAFIVGRHKLVTQNHSKESFELFDLEADPKESTDLAASRPELLAEMKQRFQVWNASVQASFEGKDYAEGKVTPSDPVPINWFEAPAYKPWLSEWSGYWAYQSYFDRTGNPVVKGKGKVDKAKK
jgi:arylsulfatase A-like enzyme